MRYMDFTRLIVFEWGCETISRTEALAQLNAYRLRFIEKALTSLFARAGVEGRASGEGNYFLEQIFGTELEFNEPLAARQLAAYAKRIVCWFNSREYLDFAGGVIEDLGDYVTAD